MHSGPNIHRRHRLAIGWWLVLCMLAVSVVPLHYHQHADVHPHEAPASADLDHHHDGDLHLVAGLSGHGNDLDYHDAGLVIESVPDITFKSTSMPLPLFVVALFLVALVLRLPRAIRQRRITASDPVPRSPRLYTPPLRAPPALLPHA